MNEKKVSIPQIFRRAEFRPDTFNAEKRTVDLVFSQGARVMRSDWFGEQWFEELGLAPENVRLGRLNNGAPVLDTHSGRKLSDVLGVVERASVDGKEGVATVRFSDRESIKEIVADIKSGILRNISVGYAVHRFEKVGEDQGRPILRATDWEPIEVSVVPAGADDGAKIRSEDTTKMHECTYVFEDQISKRTEPLAGTEPTKRVEETQPLRNDQFTGERNMPELDEAKQKEIREAAITEERKRVSEIRDAVRKAKLEDTFADGLISRGVDVNAARTDIIEELAKRDVPTRTTTVEITRDEVETTRKAAEAGLLCRANSAKYPLQGGFGREFANLTLLELARHCLEMRGVKTRHMTRMELAGAALKSRSLHSTSDFPEILANVANKSLRDAYAEAPQTFAPLVRRGTAPDFKEISRTQLGDAPKLLKVLEGGEVTRGTVSDAKEVYSLATYARALGLTRQTIVNDDMDAFGRLPQMMGVRARDLESDLVWEQITSNPVMGDGIALFHASHNNLAAVAAVISDVSLAVARTAMRKHVGLDGLLISLGMRWLIVPASLETVAEKQTSAIQPNITSSVNPFGPGGRTPLQVIVEPRLDAASALSWYAGASADQIDMIELSFLAGENGPAVETREGFDVDGMEIKVRHDVAAKVIDYRGFFKNAGA